MAQTVKNLPAMWETGVRSLGWEDPLEEGMAKMNKFLEMYDLPRLNYQEIENTNRQITGT